MRGYNISGPNRVKRTNQCIARAQRGIVFESQQVLQEQTESKGEIVFNSQQVLKEQTESEGEIVFNSQQVLTAETKSGVDNKSRFFVVSRQWVKLATSSMFIRSLYRQATDPTVDNGRDNMEQDQLQYHQNETMY